MPEDVNIGESSDLDKTVPYSRFKEVNEKAKNTEQELQALKSGGMTPEQQKEKQARDFLKGLVREELKAEKEFKKAQKTREEEEYKVNVDNILSVNTNVDRTVFMKFVKDNSDKYGITSVKGLMKLYKDLNQIKDDTVEETKENLAKKPNLPKSKGSHTNAPDYSGDKEKTYDQVVAEITREAEEQGRK